MDDSTGVISVNNVRYIVEDQLTIVGSAWGSPDNPVVLLLHGGGQTRHAWKNTAKKLAQQGWYAIALDLRGHGESSWHPEGDYRLESFAGDLRLIAATFDEPPALVGASLGGLSGLIAEGEATCSIFSSIILVDIAHRHESKGADRIIAFMKEHVEDGFASLAEAGNAVAVYLPNRSVDTDFSGLKKNLNLAKNGRYYWHWDPKLLKCINEINENENSEHFKSLARSLRIPTLLVRGHMSDVVSEEVVNEFLALVPHAKFVDIKGAGHMIAGDLNDVFSDSVIGFLSAER